MVTEITLNTPDIIVLCIIAVLFFFGCRAVAGFFKEGRKDPLKKSTYNGKGACRTTIRIEGMMCGMCEAHINDAIRKNFDIEKVSSSHEKGEAVVISAHEINMDRAANIIAEEGYTVSGFRKENYKGRLTKV